MAIVKPFKGLRPRKDVAEQVAAPPYDVLNSAEAREMAAGNPYTFLHINKPEIDLPEEVNVYDERVYLKGAENLQKLISDGILVEDATACFYVYKQIMGNHEQIGLVASASVEDYENDIVKKHEFTRPEKEDDRVKHIDTQNAQVGPVFLTYPVNAAINQIVAGVISDEPEYDFSGADGVRHTLWVVRDADTNAQIESTFTEIPYLYVADGHHRSAAAMRIKQVRQQQNPGHTGNEEYNFFLTVIFPSDQMQILDYNRIVRDLNGHTQEQLLEEIAKNFTISPCEQNAYKPEGTHHFGMYIDGCWYHLEAQPHCYDENDPVRRLDVSILQENVLAPLLGIENPRKDKRIDFVGGIRGLGELEKRVNDGGWAIAFSMYPTSIEELMDIADAGEVMPPKSTWFEPKLKSGLVTHLLK